MFGKRIVRLFLVIALMGLLTGCVAAPPSPQEVLEEIVPTVESFTLRLPRLYVQYDAEGEPIIWGIRASDLEYWTGADLSMVRIPKFYMDWLIASNLQHIEVTQNGKGIFAYVNGKPMPYLAWDGESLSYAAEVAEAFNVPNAALFRRVLPVLRHIGFDVIVQMPLQDGVAAIPYRDEKAGLMETTAEPVIAEPFVQLHLEVVYDQNGVPSVLGISAEDLEAMTGLSFDRVKLGKDVIAMLQEANIQHITLQTRGDGLFLYINGRPLPNIAWSQDHLRNAVDLYAQMNAPSAFVDIVRQFVLGLGNSDILLVVRFPLAEGAEPISQP